MSIANNTYVSVGTLAYGQVGEFLEADRVREGTVQGYFIHQGNSILDLALAPQADAEHVSAALLSHMYATGWIHATLAKVSEDEPIGAVLVRLGFTSTTDHLWMGQDLQ